MMPCQHRYAMSLHRRNLRMVRARRCSGSADQRINAMVLGQN